MMLSSEHVREAFRVIRQDGLPQTNKDSTKWDIIDPATGDRFPPKAVLRVARELANDQAPLRGGGPETNIPLTKLGFEIALKPHLESSEEVNDIKAVLRSDEDETTKQRLINARLGQGGFREALLEIWNRKCALTELDVNEALRASHIKSWCVSSNKERLDPSNGLLLAATVDALFDRHLITFDEAGSVIVRQSLQQSSLENIGLQRGRRIILTTTNGAYMKWHRAEFEKWGDSSYRF